MSRRLLPCAPLPLGYHRFELRLGDLQGGVIRDFGAASSYGSGRTNEKLGAFSVRSTRSIRRGAGVPAIIRDLAAFADFVGDLKGRAVATLPMLASFLDEPFNPSPYAPVSRLFWNEFYLDVRGSRSSSQCR